MRFIPLLLAAAVLTACRSTTEPPPSESNLTAGMVKLKIHKNKTVQADVLEVFGPPDMVTHKDDLRIWTYDKIRYDVESTSYGLLILAGAGSGNVAGGGGAGGSRRTHRSSSTSTMLILYFDEKDVVRDYRLSVTRF